jgi:hypothetical protein
MPTKKYKLLQPKTPLAYADGTKVYKKLAKKYIRHQTGFFIMAPSGAGKTYFVESQNKKHWLDGDDLWQLTHAMPAGAWWLESLDIIDDIDRRCDVITVQAKSLGFWIVGASNSWLKPDAIVIPDWDTHKQWISAREHGIYDGGATSDRLDQVLGHREWISNWEKQGVPKFKTVQEAAAHLMDQYDRSVR